MSERSTLVASLRDDVTGKRREVARLREALQCSQRLARLCEEGWEERAGAEEDMLARLSRVLAEKSAVEEVTRSQQGLIGTLNIELGQERERSRRLKTHLDEVRGDLAAAQKKVVELEGRGQRLEKTAVSLTPRQRFLEAAAEAAGLIEKGEIVRGSVRMSLAVSELEDAVARRGPFLVPDSTMSAEEQKRCAAALAS